MCFAQGARSWQCLPANGLTWNMRVMHSTNAAGLGRHIASGGLTYHCVQRGDLLIGVLVATSSATLAAILAAGPQLLLIVALLLQLLATLAFCSSVITITGGNVSIRYGPGWFRRSVALREIASCRIVRNIFAYGWGMRKAGRRYSIRLSNASAVEFELRNGRRVQIGTDRPLALVEAIFEARHHRYNPSIFCKSTWR
jgi:hypothetical protein